MLKLIFRRGDYSPNSHKQVNEYTDCAAAAKSLLSCLTLCDPIDGSTPGSPVPGILQARTLEWVAFSSSNAWKWKVKSESEVAQSCPTLRNPMDCSLPGSSVHGIFQARVLEWGVIAFSTDCARSIQLKGTKYWHMLQHEWISIIINSMWKKFRCLLKRVNTSWFYLNKNNPENLKQMQTNLE